MDASVPNFEAEVDLVVASHCCLINRCCGGGVKWWETMLTDPVLTPTVQVLNVRTHSLCSTTHQPPCSARDAKPGNSGFRSSRRLASRSSKWAFTQWTVASFPICAAAWSQSLWCVPQTIRPAIRARSFRKANLLSVVTVPRTIVSNRAVAYP